MNPKLPENPHDQEIDLVLISHKISNFFKNINRAIFNTIQFFIKNWVIVLTLVVVGFGIGAYFGNKINTYESKIIVTPNFGSTDYLYSKIELIQSKIEEKDTLFLKNTLGIQNPQSVTKIEIKPIADVYNFIRDKPENFELIKVLAEEGNIKTVLEEKMTSKNYYFQTIIFSTTEKFNEQELSVPLLKYLNTSDYYDKIQQVIYDNVSLKMTQNDSIIKQIDNVLKNISSTSKSSFKNDKLMYYSDNTQLNDIIKTKETLLNEQASQRLNLVNYNKIIKESSIILNVEHKSIINKYLKFILPVLFIIIYGFISFYKKYKNFNY